MSTTAERVIAAARSQIGYHEGRSGGPGPTGYWNNSEKYAAQVPGLAWANYQPWCDTFVAWCFVEAKALNCLVGGPTASVAQSTANAKKAGRFSEYPALGAQVLFGHTGSSHTGVVVAYDAHTITTVEGNTNTNGSAEGDGVYLKTHQRTDPWVYGYLYPDYPEGIDSADPAWPKPTFRNPPVSRSNAARHPLSPTRVGLAQKLLVQAHSFAVKKGWKRRAAALAKKIQTGPNR